MRTYRSVFCFILLRKSPISKHEGSEQPKTLMLVVYPLPDKGYRYPIRRGSGLFIYLLGVWRCLLRDRQEVIPRFFRITTKKSNQEWRRHRTKQMKKLLKYLMLLLVTTLSLTLTACGGDDDEPENPNPFEEYSIHKYDISIGLSHSIVGNTGYADGIFIWIDSDSRTLNVRPDNGWNPLIAYCGKTNRLSTIQLSSNLSWNTSASLVDGGGYIVEGVYNGKAYYIRLICRFNTNAMGKLIGCTIEYQQFKP